MSTPTIIVISPVRPGQIQPSGWGYYSVQGEYPTSPWQDWAKWVLYPWRYQAPPSSTPVVEPPA